MIPFDFPQFSRFSTWLRIISCTPILLSTAARCSHALLRSYPTPPAAADLRNARGAMAVLRRMLGGFVENVGQNEKMQQPYGSPGCVWSCVDVKLQETENTIAKCYLPRVYEKLLSDMKYEISSQAGLE